LKTELINSTRPVDYVILEYAEEQKIDLIVVGTRGRTGFKKLLLGSIASSIVTYDDKLILNRRTCMNHLYTRKDGEYESR
jgi:hypothetical protein